MSKTNKAKKLFDPLLLRGLPYKNDELDYKRLTSYRITKRFYDALVLLCFICALFSIPFDDNPFKDFVTFTKPLSLVLFVSHILLSCLYYYFWNQIKVKYAEQNPIITCGFKQDMGDKILTFFAVICVIIIFCVIGILSFVNISFLSVIIFFVLQVKIFCLKSIVLTENSLILRYRFYGDYALGLDSLVVVPENQLVWQNNQWGDAKPKSIWIARIVRKNGIVHFCPILLERNAWFGLNNLKKLYAILTQKLDIDIVRQTQKPFIFNHKLKEKYG